jgi:hypothetical protein
MTPTPCRNPGKVVHVLPRRLAGLAPVSPFRADLGPLSEAPRVGQVSQPRRAEPAASGLFRRGGGLVFLYRMRRLPVEQRSPDPDGQRLVGLERFCQRRSRAARRVDGFVEAWRVAVGVE